ncbi:sarcosine oxidase subunit gamma [Ancylobacter radicis]|uniref:Sarcosine oxidase subunit gamma family protein n=1 Tax=Ancylobacter radicis TaxID=2836179 RepID=A0ABS5REI1_9HYPH|nr:sarcosine oxidase subunit gamma family protein [Ancylobacter radicis]MBS9479234.1 sarcosine oxidase subunit gamma family protein [Ancylobacter radicis]
MLDTPSSAGHSTMPVSADPLASLASGSPRRATARLTTLDRTARLVFRGRESAIGPAGEAFGVALPREACRFASNEGRSALWLGPDEWILLAPGAQAGPIAAAIEAATAGLPHSLVDVSSRSVGIELSGPKAAFVLNQGCPLDLGLGRFPVGMCTRTLFHKAEIVLSRTAGETFRIDVWRSFAPYVWSLLEEGRRELD